MLVLIGLAGALYYATSLMSYEWRWNRVPQYFAYQAEEAQRAAEHSTIIELVRKGDSAEVVLRGEDGNEQRVTVAGNSLQLAEGDEVDEGDVIGVNRHWAAGPLLWGLWTTVWLSLVSGVLGLIIGLATGLCRLSNNPTLRDLSTLYVELVRKGDTAEVLLRGDDGNEQRVSGAGNSLQLAEGDEVDEGDVIGVNRHWAAGPLLWGLWTTVWLSLVSGVLGLIIGLVTGLCRLSNNPTLRDLSTLYVELVRGTPLLVQIFIFYFFIGTVLNLSREFAGIAALSLFTGAYVAEIIRSGVQSIARGQNEAARSLGLNGSQSMRYVVLPQAFKRVLPPLAGQFISLVKDTSLVSVIAITELLKSGREVITTSFSPFEILFCVAGLYLLINLPLSHFASRLERRLAQSD